MNENQLLILYDEIEKAITKVYKISEGELHKYKRELKEGKLPGKFGKGFQSLLNEVLEIYGNLSLNCSKLK
ncbi:hypothetical protein EYM_05800 [Ignicoccus islandicus DSM 13165]|uniref:Uncharacterized protein n=1 Tax=Ignicoccus islandicus DSM 13165 TaxID=940295 RepID=A0A0U3FQK5_9CREN|nr:hypothetical protein [Ignicoccus islandicus]ALU12623.1 hypothetical protein EYM_05800 [Ignicoccus islandicus DSM 13165]